MKNKFVFTSSFAIFLIVQLTTSSCTKTSTSVDNSVSTRIMGKQWIVDSLYENYTGSNTGSVVYVRGGLNNIQNLDNAVVIFWADGSQLFLMNNTYISYSYSFRNSDSTELLINNPSADYARILKLDANHLTIYDSTNSALSYYVYKP